VTGPIPKSGGRFAKNGGGIGGKLANGGGSIDGCSRVGNVGIRGQG